MTHHDRQAQVARVSCSNKGQKVKGLDIYITTTTAAQQSAMT